MKRIEVSACRIAIAVTLWSWIFLHPVLAAGNSYRAWAERHFGNAVVADANQEQTQWGEHANPDGDELSNLLEYALDANPQTFTPAPVPSLGPIPSITGDQPAFSISAIVRTDDPDLIVFAQISVDNATWLPFALDRADAALAESIYTLKVNEAPAYRGMSEVTWTARPSAIGLDPHFMRLTAVRQVAAGGSSSETLPLATRAVQTLPALASTPAIPGLFFTGQISARVGADLVSNTVVLQGLRGSVRVTAPSGVSLIVNGIERAQSWLVKNGDRLALKAKAPDGEQMFDRVIQFSNGVAAVWKTGTKSAPVMPGPVGDDSGYTPVETGVSETGATQISIPIVVSPGTAGMQPKLAIGYSSQGGNGPLGLGFSLSGLSAISRVGATEVHDGFKGGVSFNGNDRYTFDGQRLIAVSGADGGDSTEYRLEFDPSTRITTQGLEESSVQNWTVETKAGLKMRFGGPLGDGVSARIRPENCVFTLVWAIREIEDSAGNKINFFYDFPGSARGELVLSRISYTSNPGQALAPLQEVIFEYEDRPDTRTSYVAGFAVKMQRRLKVVESRAMEGGAMKRVRRYLMAYQQAEISGVSQLTHVQEIITDGTPLPPTSFTWEQDAAANFQLVTSMQTPTLNQMDFSSGSMIVEGDFNGDGRMDVMQLNASGGSGFWLAQGQANGGLDFQRGIQGFQAADGVSVSAGNLRTADFNADGLTDLFYITSNGSNSWIALSRGDKTFQVKRGSDLGALQSIGFASGFTQVLAPDLNGDGRTDVVIIYPSDSANRDNRVFLGSDAGSFNEVTNLAEDFKKLKVSDRRTTYSWILPGDYNGDGLADLLHLYQSGTGHWLALSNGDGTFSVKKDAQLGGLHDQGFHVSYSYMIGGDVNGDGVSDVTNFNNQGQAWQAICKGDGTFAVVTMPPTLQGHAVSDPQYTHFSSGDFNGDGLLDIFHPYFSHPAAIESWLALGAGNGSFAVLKGTAMEALASAQTYDPEHVPESRLFVGDFDGDGRDDLLDLNHNAEDFLVRSPGFDSPRIRQVTSGHGGLATIEYRPLTDPAVYTKGAGLLYPSIDLQMPMHVVSGLTSRNGVDGDALTGAGAASVGENTVTYRYEGAWTSLDGRGFQGFKAVETTDATAGIVTRTEYESSSPLLAGRPKRSVQRLLTPPANGSVVIGESESTWNLKTFTHPGKPNTYFVSEGDSVSKSYEVNAGPSTPPVKTVIRSGMVYDDYANLLESTTTTTGGGETFTEAVVNTYADAPTATKWHLGRLATSRVTKKTAPDIIGMTRKSSFSYHATTGLLTQEVIEPEGGPLRLQKDYLHDGFGNILTSTLSTGNEKPRTTTTTYTADGRFVASTKNAVGHAETKTYDPLLGNVITQTGPNGVTTTWSYDALGRPVQELRADGSETRTWYRRAVPGENGAPPRAVHCVVVQSSATSPQTVWYDLLDREIQRDTVGFDGRVISSRKVFNNRGETTHASQPFFAGEEGRYSVMTYDAVGRSTSDLAPGNRLMTTAYNGLTTAVTNPNGQTNTRIEDALGRLKRAIDAAGQSITYTYDDFGNQVKVTDANGNETVMIYDRRGRRTNVTEPNTGTTGTEYNGFGEVVAEITNDKKRTTFKYDLLGRKIERLEPGTPSLTKWTYDAFPKSPAMQGPELVGRSVGKLVRVEQGEFREEYYYDLIGRPIETITRIKTENFRTRTSYDFAGRPDTITYPTAFAVRNVYSDRGHLAEVQNAAHFPDAQGSYTAPAFWKAVTVNERGQVERERLGNGLETQRTFVPETGLIESIRTGPLNGIQNLAYAFDKIGNLTQRTDVALSISETYGYDVLNRLTSEDLTGATAANNQVTLTYDKLGNPTGRSDGTAMTFGGVAAGPHAVTRLTGQPGTAERQFTYDARGRRTLSKRQQGSSFVSDVAITYTQTNLPGKILRKPAAAGEKTATALFNYGPERSRYRQTLQVSGKSTLTRLYIGSLYERERQGSTTLHTHYIPAGGSVVALQLMGDGARHPGEHTYYVHKDHLGSVETLTDETGAAKERFNYDSWGRRRTLTLDAGGKTLTYTAPATTAPKYTARGFTGHEMLDAVGLVHMGGRVYDPLTARFLSPDPFVQSPDNLQNLNRYSYVLNNPLSFTDPSGFFFKSIGKWIAKNWKTVVAAVVTVVCAVYAPQLLGVVSQFWTGVVAAAAGGFGNAFSGTLLAGGSVGDALRAGLGAGVRAGITAGVTQGFGGGLIGKAVVNGVREEIEGGKFKHGFFAAIREGYTNAAISGGIRIAGNLVLPDQSGVRSSCIGGTLSPTGGGKFSNGAVTPAMSNALGDPPADISFNDLTHTVGSLVNLPLALPLWAAGQISPTFGAMLSRSLPATGWGSGDHTGWIGRVIGDNNGCGAPGLLGVSMGLAHSQGIWGNRAAFEAGMKAHDKITGVNFEPDALRSAGHTFGEGVGIFMSGIGFGGGAKGIFGPGNGYGFVSGYRSGLTPNLPSYSEFGNNGGIRP